MHRHALRLCTATRCGCAPPRRCGCAPPRVAAVHRHGVAACRLATKIDKFLKEINDFRRKSMKSLRKSMKNQSIDAKIDKFLKEIDDFRRKSMKSLRTSMKSGCSAMFGRCSGRVRDTFPESCLGRIPQPGFCSRQFSFLSQVCSAASS